MSDIVTLAVNGVEFKGWESLTITRSLNNLADGFSMTGPFDPTDPQVIAAFKPSGYQRAVVKIDDEVVFTGRIETPTGSDSASDRTLNIQGRSLPAVLADCPIVGNLSFNKLSLSTIARQVCQPFGIEVFAENDTNPIQTAAAEPGQMAFEFLNRLAQDYNLILKSDPQGRLLVTRPNAKGAPIASLAVGQGNLMGVTGTFDGTKRFSSYKVATQNLGWVDDNKGNNIAYDNGVKIYRPKVEAGSEADSKYGNYAAAWKRALALADFFQLDAQWSGWRTPSGKIWTPGQMITLLAPGAWILKETLLMIGDLTLTVDAGQGRTTALKPILPATYTGEMPTSYPWD